MPQAQSLRKFKKIIREYYKKHPRDFAWRKTRDPYKIFVSEIMLQQTQTDRVAKKYASWMKKFPTLASLARASFADVLTEWKSLGYNRRALALWKTSKKIAEDFGGSFPQKYEGVLALPGAGRYTAGAVMAFAFNKPIPIIETNIRTVFIHFFLKNRTHISDNDILPLVEKTLDKKDPRHWYYALMDYGVMLKKSIGNPNRQSMHYAKQSPFIGSNRQIRSAILTIINEKPSRSNMVSKNLKESGFMVPLEKVDQNLNTLMKEGFLKKNRGIFSIT